MMNHANNIMTVGRAVCPGCSYDLSGQGVVRAGVMDEVVECPECGVRTRCRDVMKGAREWPAWSFEHGLRVSFWRWVKTSARVMTPGRFWRDIGKASAVRGWRWWVFAGTWLVVFHLGLGALQVASEALNRIAMQGQYANAPGLDLSELFEHAWRWWPYGEMSVQVRIWAGGASFSRTPMWVMVFPALPLAVTPPIVLWLLARSGVVGERGNFRCVPAFAGGVEIAAVWGMGIPAIFAGSLHASRWMGTATPEPSRALLVAWMVGGLVCSGWWWFAATRHAVAMGRAVTLAVVAIGLAVVGFVGLAWAMSAAGMQV